MCSRGEGCDGEGAQPPQPGKQTPQQGDWPGCGDPQLQDRLFVLQSWVCLITGIELNVLLARFPADTRHWLCDERPLLPPGQHSMTSFSRPSPGKVTVSHRSSWGVSGHKRSEGGHWTPMSPIPARALPLGAMV